MLRIRNLSVEVPGFRLGPIDLDVAKGEFFALIGPTGSGKSLFLETLMGQLPGNMVSYTGKILWKGRDLSALPPHRRGLGILYQDAALFPNMTVEKNIRYGLKYHPIDRVEAESRFKFLVERFGLSHILHRYPRRISGGERQRTALARVLILNPEIVMLDEPLSALDPLFQEEIRQLLRWLHHELGLTFIMVSHNFDEVLYLAEKGAIIRKGTIVQRGSVSDLFNKPASSFVATFVGAKNIFQATFKGDNKARVGALEFKVSGPVSNGANRVSLRPEKIIPVEAYSGSIMPENCFTGVIRGITRRNYHLNISIEKDGLIFYALWPEQLVAPLGLENGKEVEFGFWAKDVNVFSE